EISGDPLLAEIRLGRDGLPHKEEGMSHRPPQKAGWTRRDFFNWVLNATMGVIALLVAIPVVGALLTPAFEKPKTNWAKLGPMGDLQKQSMAAPGASGQSGGIIQAYYSYNAYDHWAKTTVSDYAYLRYIGGSCPFFILSPICTHLGCHVDWVQSANQFHCPCHGSVYTVDGLNVSGPAPLPLGIYAWKQDSAGNIWIGVESTFTHGYMRLRGGPAQPCMKLPYSALTAAPGPAGGQS
ncbi:MAG: ubiquinol-cytochrome c reductase iron-sulfur subunit, partial [Firmicutes bacterium]|nr:ubiquinol-cytochrome c reductase iron-sulfur subunit [Bacillota bacterium]